MIIPAGKSPIQDFYVPFTNREEYEQKGYKRAIADALKVIDDELESWGMLRKVMGHKPKDDNAEAALVVVRSLIEKLTEESYDVQGD